MNPNLKRFLVLTLVFIYFVSPIDLLPGILLDDILVAIVGLAKLPASNASM